jgi:hypothetical protein
VTQGGVGLRSPGTPGLAIATWEDSEDALYIQRSRTLAAFELGCTFDISEIPQIERWSGWNAVVIGVIADLVQGEGPYHVPTPALFENTRFLADDFESSANAEPCQIARNPQGGVIGRRLYVVLRVEPEHDVNRTRGTQNVRRQKYQK